MDHTSYLTHLGWLLIVVVIQWGIAGRIFLRNRKAVLLPALLLGTYYTLSDSLAVKSGIWYFDPAQILGVYIGPLPIEEIFFFYLSSLLVSQSLVMFLPKDLRKGPENGQTL